MELVGKDYRIENANIGSYNIQYYICKDGIPREIISASQKVSITPNVDKQVVEIQYLKQNSADPDVYTIINNISFSDPALIYEAINLNCRYYSKQWKEAEEAILKFCNKYGLLLSRGYLYYKGLPYVSEEEKENYIFSYKGKYESIFLANFIFLISRLRTLIFAHAICRNKGTNNVHECASQDPIFIFQTLLSLLIPDENIYYVEPGERITKLCDLDYLSDYLYDTYGGMCWRHLDKRLDYKKHEKCSLSTAFISSHIPANLHEKIKNYLDRYSDLLPDFLLDCDYTVASKIEINEKMTESDKKKIEYIRNRLETSKTELISIVGCVAAIVLTRELSYIKTYIYPDEKCFGTSAPFKIERHCVTLYEQLILEVAQIYEENAIIRRCCRLGCNQMFVPESRTDKEYCSDACIELVKRAARARERREKKKEQNEEKQ